MSNRFLIVGLCLLVCTSALFSQSTFGTIVGTIKDPTGAVVPMASIKFVNQGTSVERTVVSDRSGSYVMTNVEPGIYNVVVEVTGFQPRTVNAVELRARQTIRVDASLEVSPVQEAVTVIETMIPVVNSETSNIAQTKTGLELIDLPVTLGARAAGSTSPMSTLTIQPGVQTDNAGNISVVGGQPSHLSVTVDGISSFGVRSNGPLTELFPSLETIAEIRVSEVNNSAEYSGVSDITTISKSGTNQYHGAAFWNYQNSAMDARNPFSTAKPFKIMNNAGASIGGPILKDKTFFIGSFEMLRLPRQQLVVQSVPSLAFRNGDLSTLSRPVFDPATGQPFPNNQVPVNPASARILNLLFPLANNGPANSQVNNYRELFKIPVDTNQVDGRVDHNISSRQTIFGRFTYKDIDASTAPTGTAKFGAVRTPETDWGITAAHNLIIRPNLLNEIRGGFTRRDFLRDILVDAAQLKAQIGLGPLPYTPPGGAVPNVAIAGYQTIGGGGTNTAINNDRTYQVLDNLSWIQNAHSLKFGADFRHLIGQATGVQAVRALGVYTFSGAVTNLDRNGQTSGATNPPLVGNPLAAFLLGIPDSTSYADVRRQDLDAVSNHWGLYGQDDWRITSKLNLSFGLRWEYHPMFRDRRVNVSNFLPDYVSTVNGVTVRGAVVVPNEESRSIAGPGYPESIFPTPILTAAQAGIPSTLRYSQKDSFAPRIGFAYRPFGDNKTVIRGGYGKYVVALLGALVSATYGTHSANVPVFPQQLANGQPTLRFPNPFQGQAQQVIGTQSFVQAISTNFKDPYIQQWSFTLEHEILSNTAVRLSYNGSVGRHMSTVIDHNQVPVNSVGYNTARLSRPFPLWGRIQTVTNGATSRFHSFTVEGNRRFSGGLQFQASYSLAKNLSNVNGLAPTSFAIENGALINDRFNPNLDIGNVPFTRRHRFLASFLYDLPFGRGTTFGGWRLSGVALLQSGPFLTATVPGADPSGTGLTTLCGCNGRADIVEGKTGNLPSDQRSINGWFDPAAFAIPRNNIGRFGSAPVGNLIGPGTTVFSGSLSKTFNVTESVRAQLGIQGTNLFNHPNWDIPNTVFNTANFGKISNVQSAEGAGPRVVQLSLRFTF